MSFICRPAARATLSATILISLAGAQTLPGHLVFAHSGRRSLFPTCDQDHVTQLNLELLIRPSGLWHGLNINQACLSASYECARLLKTQVLENVPVLSGSPMLCGFICSNGEPMKFCTKG